MLTSLYAPLNALHHTTPGYTAPHHVSYSIVPSLPERVCNPNLLHASQSPKLKPRLVGTELQLHTEVPGPCEYPGKQVPRPQDTAVFADVLQRLLVHGPACVSRKDEERPQRALLGLQAFVQTPRCASLALRYLRGRVYILRSLVLRMRRITRGTCPSSCIKFSRSPSPSASPMTFFSSFVLLLATPLSFLVNTV